jgi:HK97 family phage prohead protease
VSVILVDIDGTLQLGADRPNDQLIAALNASGDEIIVVSARQDTRLEESRKFLRDAGLKFSAIHLSDFPPGPNAGIAFKTFKAKALIAEGKDVTAAVDNDADTRSAYRALGLEVYSPSGYVESEGARSARESIIEQTPASGEQSEGETMPIEFRTASVELRAVGEDGYTFEGYAALYDSPSGEGATPEVIKPGAFARSISASKRGEWDVKAYQDHNPERLLGTTKSGTLSLEDDGKGLKARISLNPNITFHRDLAELVRTMGRSLGMSFGFFSTAANRVNDQGIREIRDVKLVEVSALTGLSPYYPGTISTVAVRSLASEAGIEIEPLRAAVNALLAGGITPDQAQILSDAVAAIIADDEADQAEAGTMVEDAPVEDVPVEDPSTMPDAQPSDVSAEGIEISIEVTIPRAVPRSVREKEIELARRAVK